MKVIRTGVWSLLFVALTACGGGTTPGASRTAPAPPSSAATPLAATATATASLAKPAATSSAKPSSAIEAQRCDPAKSVLYHGAPELEAMLPTTIASRDLATWSVGGRCWLEVVIDDDAAIESLMTELGGSSAIDLSHLAQAVAGRSTTAGDPPYFVLATNRPTDERELRMTVAMFLLGAGFNDVDASSDLRTYDQRTMPTSRCSSERRTCSSRASTSAARRTCTRTMPRCSS
jgi:hypothetical protein